MNLSNFIPKVKCGRCDRNYSGLKSKCPYCGAGRSRGGKRVSDVGDTGARRIIQALLLAVLVITVISMAVMDLDADPAGTGPAGGPGMTQGTEENGDNGEGDAGGFQPVLPTPAPTPPPAEVTSVTIRWSAQRGDANDFSLNVGNRLELWAEVFPTEADIDVDWEVETPTVANFTVDPEDWRRISLEARGVGQTILRATAGGETSEVIVRVRS